MELRFRGDVLSYTQPKILCAPYHKEASGPPRLWRKEIDFDFGAGLRACGFAALRETGSTSHAGFALFRRNRLIQGSADEGYRPEFIFGNLTLSLINAFLANSTLKDLMLVTPKMVSSGMRTKNRF